MCVKEQIMESLAIHPIICIDSLDCGLEMIEIPIRYLGPDYKGYYNPTQYRVLQSWQKELVFSQGCIITCADSNRLANVYHFVLYIFHNIVF